MSIFFPFIYMLIGLVIGKLLPEIRSGLSSLLMKFLIPYVIAYNLITYREGMVIFAAFNFVFCILLFSISYTFSRNKLTALSFSYLNIGWLGLPLAVAIFGDMASRIIIAAYIGSSIFGNIACVAAMQEHGNWRAMMNKTLTSPPVLAVVAGVVLRILPLDLAGSPELKMGYDLAKHLMSIVGMCILGIWLYSSRITTASIKTSIPLAFMRLVSGAIIVCLFVLIANILRIEVVIENAPVLFILPLLPPAANIVVLETYYRGTGHSASMIASGTLVSLALLLLYASALLML
ncbi:AEC family transporter [Aidingimonas lacisalsi]|uniref:permease n=1 Tax=Aidingimonas lacisalsi TaxID=2604086 RepID=UPI0011D2142A|nr:permease [Aidingimonas lacisalsi]